MKATHFIASGKIRKIDGQMEAVRPLQLVSFTQRGDGVFVDPEGGRITCPINSKFVLPYPQDEEFQPTNLIFDKPLKNTIFFKLLKFIEEVWNFDPNRFNMRPLP